MAKEVEMSFWGHLDALRSVLLRIAVVLTVGVVACFCFIPDIFDSVVLAPCRGDFFLYRVLDRLSAVCPFMPRELEGPMDVELINIRLASQFFLNISLSLWMAFLIAFPYIIYEVWRFISPALYDNEQRSVRRVFLGGTVMFYLGCLLGYAVVFPLTLRFLYTFRISAEVTNQLSLDSYMDNFLMLIFMMGVVFELPLVAVLLSRLGILTRSFFHTYRRHAIVALMVLAAIITPSSDPFTLMAVFIPIYLLWELSALLVRPAQDNSEVDTEPETVQNA